APAVRFPMTRPIVGLITLPFLPMRADVHAPVGIVEIVNRNLYQPADPNFSPCADCWDNNTIRNRARQRVRQYAYSRNTGSTEPPHGPRNFSSNSSTGVMPRAANS